ncbi:hypothetical protein LTR10_012210 [Elasticomyces elasticus]|nr:hypothetical protein LTR10_012210 [Elasticomyces elasticus]KAK4965690.1 hypothetical protein LTR42_011703 [Elasticomyces elasticus]
MSPQIAYLLAVLAAAGLSSSMAIEKRGFGFDTDCDGAANPVWDDCTWIWNHKIAKLIKANPNYEFTFPGMPNAPFLLWKHHNCSLSVNTGDGQPLPFYYVTAAVNTLMDQCEPNGAGGTATVANQHEGSHANFWVTIEAGDQTPSRKQKRDPTWENAFTIHHSAPKQYRQLVQDALPGGSSWTLTKDDTQTNSLQTSASVSANVFEIFTAEMSVQYTHDETVTTTSTETIPNHCKDNQMGTLWWYPLFTRYHGGFLGGGPSPVDIYVPETRPAVPGTKGPPSAAGRYQVVCSS